MRSVVIVCAALLLVAVCLPRAASAQPVQSAKELVAVLDFEAQGATREEATAVSDRMRQRLLESGKFRLVERELMDKMLQEQAFQQTGCTSQDCAVQVGKILGVRKMINGRLTRVGENGWVLSATMTDVETAETLRAASVDERGDFLTVLSEGTADLTLRLIGQKSEGLAEILAAAGVEAKPTHHGFSIAATLDGYQTVTIHAPAGKTLNDTGTKATTGAILDYMWPVGSAYSLSAFVHVTSIGGGATVPQNAGNGKQIQALRQEYVLYGVEGRVWLSDAIYIGALTGYGDEAYTQSIPAGNPLNKTNVAEGTGVSRAAYTVALSGGVESRTGFMLGGQFGFLAAGKDSAEAYTIFLGFRFK